jgi:hypothetical protein
MFRRHPPRRPALSSPYRVAQGTAGDSRLGQVGRAATRVRTGQPRRRRHHICRRARYHSVTSRMEIPPYLVTGRDCAASGPAKRQPTHSTSAPAMP